MKQIPQFNVRSLSIHHMPLPSDDVSFYITSQVHAAAVVLVTSLPSTDQLQRFFNVLFEYLISVFFSLGPFLFHGCPPPRSLFARNGTVLLSPGQQWFAILASPVSFCIFRWSLCRARFFYLLPPYHRYFSMCCFFVFAQACIVYCCRCRQRFLRHGSVGWGRHVY